MKPTNSIATRWPLGALLLSLLFHHASGQSCTPAVGTLSCSHLNSTSVNVLVDGLAQAAALQAAFQLELTESDVASFSADILSGYDITAVYISNSPAVTAIPHTFLSGVTSEVDTLSLTNDELQSLTVGQLDLPFKGSVTTLTFSSSYIKAIEPNAFLGYDLVTEIDVDRNDLTHLSPDTFTGLTSLTSLQLWQSQLTTVDIGGFGKLPALEIMAIQDSPLTFLQEGVFDGLPDVFEINLGSINFNCTCELQWLKDWLTETNQLRQAFCRWPIPGYFADVNFCPASRH